jgi:hypothetical protein
MIDTLKILRQAGFFKQFGSLTDDEILGKILEERKDAFTNNIGYPYDSGSNLSDQELASQDTLKVLHLDLEADVCMENQVYTWLLKRLGEISGRDNILTDVIEQWKSEAGPIELRYTLNGDEKFSQPHYLDDWVDQAFIDTILEEISNVINERFHICLGPEEEWFGQDVTYMRLTIEERNILEERLGWKFFDDFLNRMRE